MYMMANGKIIKLHFIYGIKIILNQISETKKTIKKLDYIICNANYNF